jgi:hypothetical protein
MGVQEEWAGDHESRRAVGSSYPQGKGRLGYCPRSRTNSARIYQGQPIEVASDDQYVKLYFILGPKCKGPSMSFTGRARAMFGIERVEAMKDIGIDIWKVKVSMYLGIYEHISM